MWLLCTCEGTTGTVSPLYLHHIQCIIVGGEGGGRGGDLYVVPALVCGLTGSHRFHWSAVVVDEAHRLKNAASKLHQTLSAVSVERHHAVW